MALKPSGEKVTIAEQIIEDPVSELTIQFVSHSDGTSRLQLTGPFPFGNRNFVFDKEGAECGAGVGLCCDMKPSWLT